MGMNGKVTLVSTKGNGSCKEIQVPEGMSCKEAIFAEMGMVDPDKHQICVNGQVTKRPEKVKLKDGDFVIITPTDVKGSR